MTKTTGRALLPLLLALALVPWLGRSARAQTITVAPVIGLHVSNPGIWLDTSTEDKVLAQRHYRVADVAPGSRWRKVGALCASLTLDWLVAAPAAIDTRFDFRSWTQDHLIANARAFVQGEHDKPTEGCAGPWTNELATARLQVSHESRADLTTSRLQQDGFGIGTVMYIATTTREGEAHARGIRVLRDPISDQRYYALYEPNQGLSQRYVTGAEVVAALAASCEHVNSYVVKVAPGDEPAPLAQPVEEQAEYFHGNHYGYGYDYDEDALMNGSGEDHGVSDYNYDDDNVAYPEDDQ